MAGFLLRGAVETLLTLLLVTLAVFLVGRLTGDPVEIFTPIEASPAEKARIRSDLGLDQPLPNQYLHFVFSLAHGDFGRSYYTNRPVAQLLADRTPNSLALAAVATAIALAVAFPLGVVSAVARGSVWDRGASVFAVLGQALPSFWLGLVLVVVFSVWLGWLPAAGMGTPLHFVLPGVTLGLAIAAGVQRLLRSSLIEVLGQDYVRTARAKGLNERLVLVRHAARNALIPVVTFATLMFGTITAGAVVVETVFAWPGLGRLAYDAVLARDFPILQGVVIVWALVMIALSLVTDLLYVLLDPRIRHGARSI